MKKSLKDMTDEEFRHTVEMLAHAFAARDYQRDNPLATDDDCLATAVRLTARSVGEQLGKWLPASPLSPLPTGEGNESLQPAR